MNKLEKNLEYSVKDGAAHSVMMGAGEKYLSPYAIVLGATNIQIGLLTSIPQLLGSISQLFSTKIAETIGSRKKMILIFALIQSLVWIPIGSMFFYDSNAILILILLASVYWICGLMGSPAWSSWIGDLVPDKIKWKFFGKRRRVEGISLFFSGVTAGLILYFSAGYNPFIGFVVVFGISFFAKFISWTYLRRVDEPIFEVPDEAKFSFAAFLTKMPKTNFGKLVIYLVLITFSVNITGPYFVVYMLKDLGMNYFTYMLVVNAGLVSNFLFISIWGKYSDFFGNRKIISLTGYLVFLLPILWIFSSDIIYLILVQIFSGFIWSGFQISTFNFIFDNVSPPKRVRCVSYYNVLNGIAIFLGASFGGFLLRFGSMFWSNFILILMVSSAARFLSSFIMLPMIKEVKWVKKVSEQKLIIGVVSDAFEGIKYPVLFVSGRRLMIKNKTEEFFKWIENNILKLLRIKHKYS